jgi:hypothetical protein
MNQQTTGRSPNWTLLLLIPAAVIVAKSAARHSAMWESGWTPDDAEGRGHAHGDGHGHHRRFGGEVEAGSFRLPPKIEWMLDTWHTRAHQTAEKAEKVESAAVTTTKTEDEPETV